MVERSVCLSVRQTSDDTVIAHFASLFAIGSGWLLRNSVAESLENLFLTAENPSKSLSSQVGPQSESDEASAVKFRVVCRGKCAIWHSHFDVLFGVIPRMRAGRPVRWKHEGSFHPKSSQSSTGAGSAKHSFRSSIRFSYFHGLHGWCIGSSSNFCWLIGFGRGPFPGSPIDSLTFTIFLLL